MLWVGSNHGRSAIVPHVGMSFKSEYDAYQMYNAYARRIGFSIRKSTTRLRPDGTVYQKHMVCSNQGQRAKHSKHQTSKENATKRTCCDARIQFSVSREEIWTVQKIVFDHNHYLASPNKVNKLRSQRRITKEDKQLIYLIREAGIQPAKVYEFFKLSHWWIAIIWLVVSRGSTYHLMMRKHY